MQIQIIVLPLHQQRQTKDMKTTLPKSIIDAFNTWFVYDEQLDFRGDDPQGQKAHSTKLFNRFVKECEKHNIDSFKASSILH